MNVEHSGKGERKSIRFSAQARYQPKLRATGQHIALYEDLYHNILRGSWWQFFGGVALVFLLGNALFAALYAIDPGAISGARSGSFEDAFFFSVQTMATIGYGAMAPATRFAHVMVTVEALCGILFVALVTGVTFSKFARPTARILFTENVVVTPRAGVPHLCFRMANWRGNVVVEAQLRLVILLEERTPEGEVLRRPVVLPLVRDKNPTFILSWLAMHAIDRDSPFFGGLAALEKLRAQKSEVFLSLSGLDETTGQTIHTRYSYSLDAIVWNARFADILHVTDDGTRELDYSKFHVIDRLGPPDALSWTSGDEIPSDIEKSQRL
jgi:inward rectifier potassium channel